MRRSNSERLFKTALGVIPGGVNSPVRSFGSVGGNPLYIVKGEGQRVFDADGNGYVDFCGSWGAADSWARPPGGCRGRGGDRREWFDLRRVLSARGGDGGASGQNSPGAGDGQDGQLRHRGGDDRHQAGPGIHWEVEDNQVRWLLSWPRRPPTGFRGERTADRRDILVRRGHGEDRLGHHRRSIQRS